MQQTLDALMKMFDHPHQWYGGRTFAQHGDDLAIINIFHSLQIERPSYIDIGAHHPFHLSNTALLYARGSRGTNVEANPDLIEEFKKFRPEDINVCAAVLDRPRSSAVLHRTSKVSGVNSLLPLKGHKLMDTIAVLACTLKEIITERAHGVWPDLLSIDVEGMDIPILRSSNISLSHGPKVVCAEFVSQFGDTCTELRELMTGRGYTVHSFCGSNMLFVRNDFIEMCR